MTILILKETKIENAGVYNIVASNRVGKIIAKTELIIESIIFFYYEKINIIFSYKY